MGALVNYLVAKNKRGDFALEQVIEQAIKQEEVQRWVRLLILPRTG